MVPRLQPIDRPQMLLRPVVVEALIAEDHPARAIWEFVRQLDLRQDRARVRSVEGSAGRPAFDPHLLVSVRIYRDSRGMSSARAIARLCDHDPASQWLTGMEGISGRSLLDVRIDHAAALHDLLVQVLALLSAEGLVTLERVMHDGTKVRACAASSRSRRKSRIEAYLAQARAAVTALDARADDDASLQMRRARARARRERQQRLEGGSGRAGDRRAGTLLALAVVDRTSGAWDHLPLDRLRERISGAPLQHLRLDQSPAREAGNRRRLIAADRPGRADAAAPRRRSLPRRSGGAANAGYLPRGAYVLLNPFRLFVMVNVPSSCAEILM